MKGTSRGTDRYASYSDINLEIDSDGLVNKEIYNKKRLNNPENWQHSVHNEQSRELVT
jgi:hypothetical protein